MNKSRIKAWWVAAFVSFISINGTFGDETATFVFGAISYTLAISEEHSAGYDRDDWSHWDSLEGSCMSVRDKVLAEESFVPVTTVSASGGRCRVTTGLWVCPYTGATYTDSSDVDVDHLVPLAEAHQSGGYGWDAERRRAYANDLSHANHLIIVDDSENQSKSDGDPTEYLPRNEFLLTYLQAWVRVKARWGLSVDSEEALMIHEKIDSITSGASFTTISAPSEVTTTLSTEDTESQAETSWSITFVDAQVVRNDSVGRDWETDVYIDNRRVTQGKTIRIIGFDTARVEARAIERDDGGDDIGDASTIARRGRYEDGDEFTIQVTVRENGGRYSGNTAVWMFRFRISMS